MTDHRDWRGTIRKLCTSETGEFRDHLLRLGKTGQRSRFAHSVSDKFVADYAERMLDHCSIVFAYIEHGDVRATAELRMLEDHWGEDAEAAFTVEAAYEDNGIGSELMGYVIRSARNRGIKRLHMCCLAENRKMQAIARKYEAELQFEAGDVVGEIQPEQSNNISVVSEAADDRIGFIHANLDLASKPAVRLA
ncbi:MAG: GNAT family N-acetyltransferase [Hyphomicrobiaceae bacterium]